MIRLFTTNCSSFIHRIVSLLLLVTLCSNGVAQTTYYIAANGSDGNSGRSAESPFQSLAKVNATLLQPGDQVLFRRGDTFRGGLLIRQSGSAAQPIRFDAYGTGAKPILSGAIPLTNWTKVGTDTWQTTCSACTGPVTGVFRNDKALPLGRYPNPGDTNKGYLTVQTHQGNSQITSRQPISLNLNTGWKGTEVVIRTMQWITNRYGFSSQSGNVLNLAAINSGYGIQDGWGYFVQNHPATLDRPGEWAFDTSTKTIQLYDATGDPNKQNLTVTAADQAVDLASVQYISLTNLSLTQARTANLSVRSGSSLTFSNLDILNAGEDGVVISGTGQAIVIENSTIRYINNNGVWIGPYQNVTFRNNILNHVGVDAGRSTNNDGQGNGLQTSVSQAMLIENNRIDSIGYNAISFTNSTTIRKNVISNFCLTKSDGGGIYTWNGNKNAMSDIHLTSNIIFNGIGAPEGTPGGTYSGANGIYFDDCTQNADITGNTIFNCTGLGIYLHAASNLSISGNTSYNNSEGQLALTDNKGVCTPRNNSIHHNILAGRISSQTVVKYESNVSDLNQYGTFDNNSYIRPFEDIFKVRAIYNDGTTVGSDLSLAEWQTRFGKDMNSRNSPATFNDYVITTTGKSLLTNTFGSTNENWETWSPYGNGRAQWDNTNRLDEGSLQVGVASASNKTDSYVLAYTNIGSVTKGKTYYLQFDALASSAKRVDVFLRQRSGSYQDLVPRKVIMLNNERMTYEVAFTPTMDEASALLVYQASEDGQTAWFDNIGLKEAIRTDVNPDECIRLFYNPTLRDSVVLFTGGYRDAMNRPYAGSLTLAPLTSLLLIKDPTFVPQERPTLVADLSLTLQTDRQVLPAGQSLTVRLRIRNEQLTVANGAVSGQWTCRLPSGLQFSGVNGVQYTDGVLSGAIQNLRVGTDTTIVFLLKLTQPGTYRLAAQITTATLSDPDSTPGSGTADGEDDAALVCFRTPDAGSVIYESPNPGQRPLPVVTTNQPAPNPNRVDLSLQMALSNRSPAINELVTCTIWVNNGGGAVAGTVQLQNKLPDGLDFVGGTGWSANGKLLSTSLTNVQAGGVTSTSFQARVTSGGRWINQVQITLSDIADTDSIVGNGFENGEDDQAQADIRVR